MTLDDLVSPFCLPDHVPTSSFIVRQFFMVSFEKEEDKVLTKWKKKVRRKVRRLSAKSAGSRSEFCSIKEILRGERTVRDDLTVLNELSNCILWEIVSYESIKKIILNLHCFFYEKKPLSSEYSFAFVKFCFGRDR